jgi:A/G-specific adenine glycosylase
LKSWLGLAEIAALRHALVEWFRRGHRDMPWRRTKDPYAIWVSEIMLQQTRVDTVRDYYARWMARLPTVRTLAAAPLDEVLALWSGLGYYARARNLHAAAQLCAQDGVPRDPARLRALPGVGAYTAGAIASIAFDLPEPILDGNVARVLARVFAIDGPSEARKTREALWDLARALVPSDAASDFNQAMMELGAMVCTPRDPACDRCPIRARCRARAEGRQTDLPRKKASRRAMPTVEQVALVATRGAGVLLGRRPARGLWGGLWEPPCLNSPRDSADPEEAAARAAARFGLNLFSARAMKAYQHELTHRRYRFHPVVARAQGGHPRDCEGGYEALRWVDADELSSLGLAAWARRVIEDAGIGPKETPR